MKQHIAFGLALLFVIMMLSGCGQASQETAQSILDQTGLNADVAPAEAEDVSYALLELETDAQTLTVAEVSFTLDGIAYCYRTAATGVISDPIYDLTQHDLPDAVQASATLGWCVATLYYEDGGAGKIIWFDIVPGLLYSLEMETGASAEALTTMAEYCYTPAQGEVG